MEPRDYHALSLLRAFLFKELIMNDSLYFYKGFITGVYDGDTVTASFDLGMRIKRDGLKIRLNGIDAPELRGKTLKKGRESRDFLRSKILNKDVIIQTIRDKKGKYGRYLANIWFKDSDDSWCSINDMMITEGFAVKRNK
jgi:micrococcal nuclease